ncbi:MAG TPA: hypothetical protein DDW52_21210 [Planctomycetaceae bacterium]|nr:hypothetical protein [Planctomycetaceae bacterium]
MPALRPAGVLPEDIASDQIMSLDESGVYFYPDYSDADSTTSSMAVVYFKKSASMGAMMGGGIFHMFVCAAFAAGVVARLNLPSFSSRFGYVLAMGFLIATWADVGNMIWWHYPPVWAGFHYAYDILSWTLAGLLIAAIIKPETAELPS